MLLSSSHRILYIVNDVRYTLIWSLIAWLVVGAWEVTLEKLQTESDNQVMISIEKVGVAAGIKCESDARTEAEKIFQNVVIDNSQQPFYVGDEVEIEEVKMYVEELRLMETVFKGIDKQYQYLSNFGLYDKLLKNNSRSELPAWKIDDNEIV
ncbi:unnamed protein product [Brassica rapa]|uniref:Uncharacterized protein n=1 Tax=Brassica campestris TaxID=3711 RepID=A0A3P6C2A6_BRACM|nr:unnamed protein product [Brassica rapa]VDD07384.1 unnamed protein product [Brassica rapa]